QDVDERLQPSDGSGRHFQIEAEWVAGSGIALDGGDVIRKFRGVSFGVGLVSAASVFLVHPGDHAQRAARADVQTLEQFGGGHGDDDTSAVVDGAATEVPGIKVTGDHDDLLGMLAAFQVGDNVIAGGVGQALRSEREVHADSALGG